MDNDIQMMRLGLDETEQMLYQKNRIYQNKRISKAFSAARSEAKRETCFYCNKPTTSFCKSHSIPQFCLKRIAIEGKVYYANTLISLPFWKSEQGVGDAGTFQLICRDCDSKIFQEYETPENYKDIPSGKMLAQIAMKNYMQMISKRFIEKKLYTTIGKAAPNWRNVADGTNEVNDLDLVEYLDGFNRAKLAALGNHDDWYYLCFFTRLNYTVPIAFQGGIVLISDFEGNTVNDIYNLSPKYHTDEIHIAVFPLKHESIVMLFIDSRNNKYRKFYRQLNKLTKEDQLAAINYIIFAYSENVYLSKLLEKDILSNPHFIQVCQTCSNVQATHPYVDPLPVAKREFDLSRRSSIPNLLCPKYALIDTE